jgi:hypothetical protein
VVSGIVQGMRRLWWIAAVPLLAACTATPTTAPTTPPPPPPEPWPVTEAAIASLIARPLRVPTVSPGGKCPVSGVTERSPVAQEADARGLGTGPLYPITFYIGEDATLRLGKETPRPDGLYELKVVWATTEGYQGPAVVRVARLDGPGRGFVWLSYHKLASRGDAVVFPPTEYPSDFPAGTAVSGPGCYAYQIDGKGLEEVIVFRVVA